jgi:hypothetical protein
VPRRAPPAAPGLGCICTIVCAEYFVLCTAHTRQNTAHRAVQSTAVSTAVLYTIVLRAVALWCALWCSRSYEVVRARTGAVTKTKDKLHAACHMHCQGVYRRWLGRLAGLRVRGYSELQLLGGAEGPPPLRCPTPATGVALTLPPLGKETNVSLVRSTTHCMGGSSVSSCQLLFHLIFSLVCRACSFKWQAGAQSGQEHVQFTDDPPPPSI